jgi:DNA (cytosine-5)-methyltransferase 1
LGDILVDEEFVPEEFFISDEDLPKWQYEKGAKKINRVSKEGYEYVFSEGGMAFPDSLDKPSRTMITGEGGTAPSRFKHVVLTPSGRYRRLIPIELERLNMFPDNHTLHAEVSDGRRAFLMGNALVCGVVQEVGKSLYRFIYNEAPISHNPIHVQRDKQPKLELSLFDNLTEPILCNAPKKTVTLDQSKRLLIGLVKEDNTEYFLDNAPTKIYYTGKTRNFPSTIALNKLYYFMPYIKGKGVRDLYVIRIARIGNKAEIHPQSKDKEPRLVFELELLKQFPEYINIQPNVLYTYRDTTLGYVMSK